MCSSGIVDVVLCSSGVDVVLCSSGVVDIDVVLCGGVVDVDVVLCGGGVVDVVLCISGVAGVAVYIGSVFVVRGDSVCRWNVDERVFEGCENEKIDEKAYAGFDASEVR